MWRNCQSKVCRVNSAAWLCSTFCFSCSCQHCLNQCVSALFDNVMFTAVSLALFLTLSVSPRVRFFCSYPPLPRPITAIFVSHFFPSLLLTFPSFSLHPASPFLYLSLSINHRLCSPDKPYVLRACQLCQGCGWSLSLHLSSSKLLSETH